MEGLEPISQTLGVRLEYTLPWFSIANTGSWAVLKNGVYPIVVRLWVWILMMPQMRAISEKKLPMLYEWGWHNLSPMSITVRLAKHGHLWAHSYITMSCDDPWVAVRKDTGFKHMLAFTSPSPTCNFTQKETNNLLNKQFIKHPVTNSPSD